MRVYQCEDSIEGVFTAIYNAYEDRSNPMDTRLSLTEELLLFAEYRAVVTNTGKAIKVADTLRRRFGEENYFWICLALSAEDEEKAQAVYRTVVHGLTVNSRPEHLYDHLADADVHKVFALGRNANYEYLHMRGFLRFEELEGNVLYAEMGPKNNLMTFLMPHFADRLPMEHFLIYDEKRHLYGVHPAGRDWYLVQGEMPDMKELSGAARDKAHAGEVDYQELFRYFCEKIGVEERRNPELQRNMLPLRFRGYMTEFQK